MNYTLMEDGYLPTSIKKDTAKQYFATLETYCLKNDLTPSLSCWPGMKKRYWTIF